jgi:hypothetical protein
MVLLDPGHCVRCQKVLELIRERIHGGDLNRSRFITAKQSESILSSLTERLGRLKRQLW